MDTYKLVKIIDKAIDDVFEDDSKSSLYETLYDKLVERKLDEEVAHALVTFLEVSSKRIAKKAVVATLTSLKVIEKEMN